MNEFEVLAIVFVGVVLMIGAMILCLRWGAEQERQARIEALNKKSPLGVLSERLMKNMAPEIISNICEQNTILKDLPFQGRPFMRMRVIFPAREKPRIRPLGSHHWMCVGLGKSCGVGRTMEQAYEGWLKGRSDHRMKRN